MTQSKVPSPETPLVIGLTGSIAAGKSTAGQILESLGAVHCDADKLVHRLYDPGTPGFERVVEAFGRDVIGPDGYVDRKALGAKVFGKPDEMNKLTRAMGSITETIKAEIDGWRGTLGGDRIAVMEAVNLMEPGYARWCDQTWLIGVDDDVAKQRLQEARGMSEAEADQRLASQRAFSDRAPGADWTYLNNGTMEELEGAIRAQLDRILGQHRAETLPVSVFAPWWEAFKERAQAALKAAGVNEDKSK
jgi:dephospho-CoA kinase